MDSIYLFFGYINGKVYVKNDDRSLYSESEIKKNNLKNY